MNNPRQVIAVRGLPGSGITSTSMNYFRNYHPSWTRRKVEGNKLTQYLRPYRGKHDIYDFKHINECRELLLVEVDKLMIGGTQLIVADHYNNSIPFLKRLKALCDKHNYRLLLKESEYELWQTTLDLMADKVNNFFKLKGIVRKLYDNQHSTEYSIQTIETMLVRYTPNVIASDL